MFETKGCICCSLYDHKTTTLYHNKNMSQNAGIQNSGNNKKFNFNKWSFIFGTSIAVVGAIATAVTVPEVRCSIGLKSEACVVEKQEVELITLAETGNPLALVRIQVISQGTPEVTQTDNNGYGKVKIPSKGDVNVILSKEGYPTQRFLINLKNDQSTTRTIWLSQSGKPEVKSSVSSSQTASVPSPSATTSPTETTASTETTSTPTSSSNLLQSYQSPLFNTDCQSATPGKSLNSVLRKIDNVSLTLGREVLPQVAYMGDVLAQLTGNEPLEFVCNLKSSYKELKLVFGIHSGNQYAFPNRKLLFQVFLDGKSAGTREVVVGTKQEWTLNLQGIKNVSLRGECTTNVCPALGFTEMSLK
ncbi:hypothetical protein F7734_43245 [Scytonema sp. UIC 10036]|uniref:hypothetical protein n=1 Tax=Scytonema sp. UIC 10036 TaxID=2304196 RepID=UPI0012DAA083|nr:hypothetical protein [Scytonema sp. UIC 10036]MUG98750.1 hypothetical protein [Scytonema sp. UIC 10036]